MNWRMICVAAVVCAAANAGPIARGQDEPELANKARAILQKHCYRCHGEKGAVEGGVNYILDRQQLVARKKVVPNAPAASRVLKRILLEEMPPEGEKSRPSPEEVALLKSWIAAGAPDFDSAPRARPLVTHEMMLTAIHKDLTSLPEHVQRFIRYFTITHLHNAGLSGDELDTHRQGISKLINSLSWGKRITPPAAIDPARTILRIDLRDYKWSRANWELLESFYPFGLLTGSKTEKQCQEQTGSTVPHLRGDWFVAAAALPPLYHELLQIPATDRALEKLLKVDVREGLEEGLAIRAGFNGSGVSRNNRLIERHPSLFGGYWKSYDFGGNTGKQNLFAFPLGPGREVNSFRHDGGEIIFSLPNGLQGYMLTDAKGQRLDKGPTAIVSDPRRPDRAVVNGLSCMSCHSRGILFKDDQVRAHVDKNRTAFQPDEVSQILTLYVPAEQLRQAMQEDADRFRDAVAATGCRLGATEPIVALALRFEAELDLGQAAAELGMTADELRKSFTKSVTLGRLLGPLAVDGGTVQRDVFTQAFADVVRDLERGNVAPVTRKPSFGWSAGAADPSSFTPLPPGIPPGAPRPPEAPLTKHPWEGKPLSPFPSARDEDPWYCRVGGHKTGLLHAVSYSPKNVGWVAYESSVGVASILDRAEQSTRADMHGHSGSILALDFAPDGSLLATGSVDRTARIWNAATGREVHNLGGHAGFVRAVKFAPNGHWLATGSERIRIWDVATGAEKLATVKAPGWVESLAISADSRVIASAGNQVQLWDADTGKLIAEPDALPGVQALAFSPDGTILAMGGAEGKICLWDCATRQVRRVLTGHRQPVCTLAFSSNGKLLLSGSGGRPAEAKQPGEFKAWDPDTGKELSAQQGHAEGITCVAVSADGRQAVTVGLDGNLRFRDLMALGRTPLGPFEGHWLPVWCAAVLPDASAAVTASEDRTVRVWDLANGAPKHRLEGHTLGVRSVVVSPDSKWLYSGSTDKTVRKWDLKAGKPAGTLSFRAPVTRLALSANGDTLAVVLTGNTVVLVEPVKGKTRLELTGPTHLVALSADGRRLALANAEKHILIWDVDERREIARIGADHSRFRDIQFSPDGRRLLTADVERVVCAWDVATGKEVMRYKGLMEQIHAVAYCDGGKKVIASAGMIKAPIVGGKREFVGCAVRCWDAETGAEVVHWNTHPLIAQGFAVSDIGRCAVLFGGTTVQKRNFPEDPAAGRKSP